MVDIMTYLIAAEYLCHRGPRTCCPSNNSVLFSSLMLIIGTSSRLARQGITNEAGTAYTPGTPAFSLGFSGVRVAQSLVFLVVFCRPLFVLLSVVMSVLKFTASDFYLIGLFPFHAKNHV